MNINRHNYEECFLLYIDNELSVDQKKQVELFVKENPDVEEELVMLQQSRLIPDNTIVFDKKHLMMKEENNSLINLNNYEEWLVLYIDNELNEEDKTAVEKFAATHSHVQQELAFFKQTKIQPEKIVFADKEGLFRKGPVRVTSMQWLRIAVAAILVIAAGITLYSILHSKNNPGGANDGIVKTEIKKQQVPDSVKVILTKPEGTYPNGKEKKEQVVVTTPIQIESKKQKQQPDNLLYVEKQLEANADSSHKKSDVIAVNSSNNPANPQIKNTITLKPQQIFKDPGVTNQLPETPQPIYASNTDNNENKKFRGFFRKAARIIERTTNINPANDDNKVLIGGMAINLK